MSRRGGSKHVGKLAVSFLSRKRQPGRIFRHRFRWQETQQGLYQGVLKRAHGFPQVEGERRQSPQILKKMDHFPNEE
jgi:hypothetical protein